MGEVSFNGNPSFHVLIVAQKSSNSHEADFIHSI